MNGLSKASVTDTKSATGDTFDNRNGGTSRTLEELTPLIQEQLALGDAAAAEIGALFSAADPRTDEEKRLWRLIRESTKTAAFCGKCERAIARSDTVYRPRLTTRGFFLGSHGTTVAVVCHDCGEGLLGYFVDPRPCEQCKRPVRVLLDGRLGTIRIFCSGQCQTEFYRNLAIERRREARAKRKPQTCEVCNNPFEPSRTDAKHCSPACKQKAYRQRKKINVSGRFGG